VPHAAQNFLPSRLSVAQLGQRAIGKERNSGSRHVKAPQKEVRAGYPAVSTGTPSAMETNFGTSTPYSLGVEEEFQLVELDSFELVSKVEPVLEAFLGETAERVKPEILQSFVEVSTRIGADTAEVIRDLADLRTRLARAALENDAAIIAAGTHPFSRYADQDFTDRPRYAELAESHPWVADRQIVFGLHVHVGVGSAAKAIACINGLRNELPELLALSANSPFWQGRPTGLASTRAKIIEGLPRTGIPPFLESFEEFEQLVAEGERTGAFPDYTRLWWDIRPHPQLGTVEVRICDAQTRLESVAAIVALIQALTALHGADFDSGILPERRSSLLLEENKWRALRDGLDARLIDLRDESQRPAREAIADLVERCMPAADALGCAAELGLVSTILLRGNGADEQRRLYGDPGDLDAIAWWLADQTLPGVLA
jgi:glutamate---cysteine ligase / carboxylate-amine ligase